MKVRVGSCVRGVLLASSGALSACSSGTGGPAGSGGPALETNTVPVEVNAGPGGIQAGYVNGLYVAVTLCTPGSTTNCQTIDGISVDTGSSGLRVLSSALTLSLGAEKDANGNTNFAVTAPQVPAPRVCREDSAACTPTTTTSTVPPGG